MARKEIEYREVEVLGRKCYVTHEDFRIFYGMAGNVTGKALPFRELPGDAFIVRIVWERKRARLIAAVENKRGHAARTHARPL